MEAPDPLIPLDGYDRSLMEERANTVLSVLIRGNHFTVGRILEFLDKLLFSFFFLFSQ